LPRLNVLVRFGLLRFASDAVLPSRCSVT